MPKKETRSPGTPVPARRPTGPPPWALAAIAGIIAMFTLGAYILSERDVSSWIRLPKPFDNNGGLTIVLFIAMCVAVIVVIVTSKVWEARRAAAWPPAAGRVVKSTIEARRHQSSGEATTVTNVPAVEYEFAVAGTTYRGARISIGEDSGGANTEATLSRYPVGATVTVYYDPADPTDCVLERDIPRGLGRGCALFAGIGAAAVAGIYWLATSGKDLVAAHLPEGANAPLVILTSAMGLAASAIFFAARRISEEAAEWPVTRGKVVISSTETFYEWRDGREQIFHAPVVEFTYQVHGHEYRSRQITLGSKLAGTQSLAARIAARYPQGSTVEVHYDPANLSNAVLQVASSLNWLPLGVALLCLGVAVYASGGVRH